MLKDRVRELRPACLPPYPASRTAFEPGELTQWDFWLLAVMVPELTAECQAFRGTLGTWVVVCSGGRFRPPGSRGRRPSPQT